MIAHGRDRAQALDRLDRALSELELLGVVTNAAFTRALIARADVRAGDQDTGLLERVLAEEQLNLQPPPDLLAAGALAAAGSACPPGAWRRRFTDAVVRIAGGQVDVDGQTHGADVRALGDGDYRVELDVVARRYAVLHDDDEIWVGRDGYQLRARTLKSDRSGVTISPGSLEAPMPGTVLQVRVQDGDEVSEGDVLLVLESMKMELSIAAPYAGVVSDLALEAGDRVELGQPLVAVHALNGSFRCWRAINPCPAWGLGVLGLVVAWLRWLDAEQLVGVGLELGRGG